MELRLCRPPCSETANFPAYSDLAPFLAAHVGTSPQFGVPCMSGWKSDCKHLAAGRRGPVEAPEPAEAGFFEAIPRWAARPHRSTMRTPINVCFGPLEP